MVEYENILSQIKELLKDHPKGLNIRSISKEININRMSVAKYLEVLTARGMVDYRVVGNSKIFSLAQQVPLSTLFKFSSNLIVVLNQHLQIIQVNDAFLKYANASKQEIINSKLVETGLDITNDTKILSAVSDVLRGNEKNIELDIIGDGEKYFYNVNLTPIVFEDLTPGIILFYEDITTRKNTEIALNKNKEKYETLFNCVNDAIVITDLKGNFLEINDTFIDRFGYSREELLISDFRPENFHLMEFYKKIKILSNELFETGSVFFETTLITKNGISIPHEISCRLINFMGEKAILFIGHDTHERSKADDTLKDSEITYRTIFENNRIATIVVDEDASIILANTGWEYLTGISKEESTGRSFTEFIHHNDIEQMLKYHQIRRVDQNLAPNNYEFRLINPMGEVYECLLNINMIPGTRNSIASITDIREYKYTIENFENNEKVHREFLDGLPVPVFETGAYGNITYFNRNAMEKTGYDNEDILKGLHFRQLLKQDKHDLAVTNRKKIVEGSKIKDLKLTVLKKDGTDLPMILYSTPVYKNNKFSGTRGYIIDDTPEDMTIQKMDL